MTLRQVCQNFWLWLTEPVNPLPLATFRVCFGIILLLNGAFLFQDLDMWFSAGGIFPSQTARAMIGSNRLNVFLVMGDHPRVVAAVFWAYMGASALLTLGLFPQRMSLVVFIALASFSHRNIYILHSGDTFLRVASFLMIFAPSGAALSLESKIRGHSLKSINPAAFRALQFQVCLLYAAAVLFKLRGDAWLNGSAVYIVQQLTEFQHFPVPGFLRTPFMSKVQTWGTLVAEFSFPLLVWFRDTRMLVIAAMVVLHLGIEYSMNIQLFEWTLMSAMVLFLTPSEIKRILWANPSAR